MEPQTDPLEPPAAHIPTQQQRRIFTNTTDLKTLFSLDETPPSQWRDKLLQMYALVNTKMQAPNVQLRESLIKFVARLSGRLREW